MYANSSKIHQLLSSSLQLGFQPCKVLSNKWHIPTVGIEDITIIWKKKMNSPLELEVVL